MQDFQSVSEFELRNIDGGGLVGAVTGYIVGVCVGGIAAATVYADSDTQGSRNQGKAAMAAFTSAVISCTAIGAAATGIF